MPAPYDARKLANLLLDRFDAVQWELSNKKINKILYFIHGIGLARLGYPLVKNHFEAWEHGPVVSVIYKSFKQFEYRPISTRATAFNYIRNQEEILAYSDIELQDRNFLLKVAEYYVEKTAGDLEAMTHEADTPWSIVRGTPMGDRGIHSRIPDDLIKRYFVERLGARRTVN